MARLYAMLTLLSMVPLAVGGAMIHLHLTRGADLRAQGEGQSESYATIDAMRGSILDRDGRLLVANTSRYQLALDPEHKYQDYETGEWRIFSEEAGAFYEHLSAITGTPASEYRRLVRERSSPKYVVLERNLNAEQIEAIRDRGTPGIRVDGSSGRTYAYGTTASHILGYVSSDDRGLEGLERQYNDVLTGTPGRRAILKTGQKGSQPMVGGAVIPPRDGESLVLTIDLVRQSILEDELQRGVRETGARSGTAVAMDPNTGAILAMANYPTYNPNRPAASPADARRNRAITDRMEPGSTFKLVAAAAFIEQDLIELDDTLDTGQGWGVFGGRTVKDTHGYGRISFAEVIARSSNVGMAQVVERLDSGVLYQYARNLGFGQPTWIDLPGEVGGVLKRPSEWSRTSRSALSRGYEVDATPLQVLVAYSAFANGGRLVQPYIVAERRTPTGEVTWVASTRDSIRQAMKRRTTQELLPAFERVVTEGTATQTQLSGLRIAGKTGTARKIQDGAYTQTAYRASFVGFFPAEAPEVAMLIVLDEPQTSTYGGDTAAPVFRRVVERWAPMHEEVERRLMAERRVPRPKAYPVPRVEGEPVLVAAARLRAAGFSSDGLDASDGWVEQQMPAAGDTLVRGASPRLEVRPDSLVAPSRASRELSTRDALYRLHKAGTTTARISAPGQVGRTAWNQLRLAQDRRN